jgi:predicted dehydrogenase
MGVVGVATIGAGHWGERHAHAYSCLPEARLVAICDIDRDRAAAMASRYGALRSYQRIESVLDDAEVHAVSIVLPDHLHVDAAIACAEAGRHLLIEKPLALTVKDAESIAAAARAHGVRVMVNFTNRWNVPLRKAKDYLDTQAIGRPRYAYMRMNNTLSVPTRWLAQPEQTSVLWWIGSHSIDLARWIFVDEVQSVSAVSRSGKLTGLGISTADFFITTLRFSNGGVAVIENNWILPNEWPGHVDVKVEVITDSGVVAVDPYHHRAVEFFGAVDVEPFESLVGHGNLQRPDLFYDHRTGGSLGGAMLDAVRHFIRCVLTDTEPDVTVHDGIEVTRIIVAATRAAHEDAVVVLRG